MEPKLPDKRPFHTEALDRRWVMVGHMDEWGHGRTMDLLETDLGWAFKQGWSIVFRWRDNPKNPDDIDPSQSNPHRDDHDDMA